MDKDKIKKHLISIGLSASYEGFNILVELIYEYKKGEKFMDLYNRIAERFGNTRMNIVRRASYVIRHLEDKKLSHFIATTKIILEMEQ